jgi:hypothetical protein
MLGLRVCELLALLGVMITVIEYELYLPLAPPVDLNGCPFLLLSYVPVATEKQAVLRESATNCVLDTTKLRFGVSTDILQR